MGKIMVVTGEVSGDMHAAQVVKAIKEIAPDITFYGMGSTFLKKEGVEILIDPGELSTIGFIEAFKNTRQHLANLRLLKKSVKERRPDLILLVDNSGFNMLLARAVSRLGVPLVNYFSPSAWVWGSWRAGWMTRYRATIASVFPMEAEVYRRAGADVEFVGHPLLDMVRVNKEKEEICHDLELSPDRPVIGLLPGSRRQEVEKLLPDMLEAAAELAKENKGYQFVLPLADGIDRSFVARRAARYSLVVKLVEGFSHEVMKIAAVLVTASGTATLEAAIIGTPMLIVYRTSASTYWLATKLMKTDYVGLPNIIAGKEIVPELIQQNLTADRILFELKCLLESPFALREAREQLAGVKQKLGSSGAVRRVAELVLKKANLS
ncbi:lipid-A-disaccharide synthase [Iocasia frigidifontis]|uniref:Lipid-A-disaccharide synthase n=1 Tax=Iocasia fonsfrigidae TaxID=2682810 RepID=A0A8A7KDC3_9FIRM|nr:lipid-A-disaccharide synthase [Iocasia fonsfrigidae]QTL96897.1 lipid-A-disaccharide synthase [Iocasia fonsfrigidae]